MRTHLIHCSYHKCLTVYFGRVMGAVFNRCLPWSGGYRHYNSHLAGFYDGFRAHRVASVNNRDLDLERLGRFRVSRFVRDPRDLVSPTEEDWYFANGRVPEGLRRAGDPHVRNPASGQWRHHFTPRIREAFTARYGGLLRRLGYAPD